MRAVTCCLGNNQELSLQELSLDKNLPAGSHLTEIPAFVETKALPVGARDVQAMHQCEDGSVLFIFASGYTIMTPGSGAN